MLERWGTPLAFALALAPALLTWARCRRHVAAADGDREALAERLAGESRRAGIEVALAWTAAIVLTPHAVAAILLAWIGQLVGSAPARRALTGEALSPPASVAWTLRTWVGLWGAILVPMVGGLIAVQVAAQAGIAGVWVGAAFLVATVALVASPPAALARLLAARPLDDPDLARRFAEIEARAELELPVAALRVGGERQYLPGAWATATARRAAVAYGRTLLEALEPDEIAAIHAHELAHVEHWKPDKLRRQRVLAMLPIAALLVAVPWMTAALELALPLIAVPMLLTPLLALRAVAAASRKREAGCDLRAAELLGGDVEPLVRALTKLTRLHHTPERLAPAVEQAHTHPSLAHRVLALRRAARGAEEATVGDTLEAELARDGDRLRIDAEGVAWKEGDAEHRLDATELTLAAVQLAPDGDFLVLRSRARAGRRPGDFRLPIRAEDVERIDAATFGFAEVRHDATRAPAAGATGPPWLLRSLGRAIAAVMCLVGLLPVFPGALGAIGVAVLVRPARRWFELAVLASGVALVLTWAWPGDAWAWHPRGLGMQRAILALLAFACLIERFLLPDEDTGPRGEIVGAALLALAAIAPAVGALLALGSDLDAFTLHLALRERSGGAVACVALGALLLVGSARWLRGFGALALALGLGWVLLGSRAALPLAERDPLGIDARPAAVVDIGPTRVGTRVLDGWDWNLRLSPGGALTSRGLADSWDPQIHRIDELAWGRDAREPRMAPAIDIRFLDDRRALVLFRPLEEGGGRLALRELDLGDGAMRTVAEHVLPDGTATLLAHAPRLVAPSPGDATARVSGYGNVARAVVVAELPVDGAVPDGGPAAIRSWRLPDGIDVLQSGDWVFGGGAPPLVLGVPSDRSPEPTHLSFGGSRPPDRYLLVAMDAAAPIATRLAPWIFAATDVGAPQLIVASDGARSHLWSVDPATRELRPHCVLRGVPRAAASDLPSTLMLYTTARELLRVGLQDDGCAVERIALLDGYSIYELAYTADAMVALADVDGEPRLLRLELPPRP